MAGTREKTLMKFLARRDGLIFYRSFSICYNRGMSRVYTIILSAWLLFCGCEFSEMERPSESQYELIRGEIERLKSEAAAAATGEMPNGLKFLANPVLR
jgi:hypothetical protein